MKKDYNNMTKEQLKSDLEILRKKMEDNLLKIFLFAMLLVGLPLGTMFIANIFDLLLPESFNLAVILFDIYGAGTLISSLIDQVRNSSIETSIEKKLNNYEELEYEKNRYETEKELEKELEKIEETDIDINKVKTNYEKRIELLKDYKYKILTNHEYEIFKKLEKEEKLLEEKLNEYNVLLENDVKTLKKEKL